jgi:hypothetical protein
MREGTLAYGFLRGFGDGDALVFIGDRLGVRRFAQLLREAGTTTPRAGLRLDDLPFFEGHGMTRAVLEFGEAESSAEAADRGEGRIDVLWRLSSQDAFQCADALEVLAIADHAAHQYLEKAGDIQIIVSVDEYDPSMLDRT